jgi:uncharacterized membrane protein
MSFNPQGYRLGPDNGPQPQLSIREAGAMADLGVAAQSGGQRESTVRLPRFQPFGRAGRFRISLIVFLLIVVGGLVAQPSNLSDTTFTLLGYGAQDVSFVVYLVLTYLHFRSEPAARIQARATVRRGWFRMVRSILLWAGFAFGQIYSTVVDLLNTSVNAPEAPGEAKVLMAANLWLSWLVLHAAYAEFYARKYYRENGGLNFAGTHAPDYRDFAYFSYAIGMTFGTTDVEATSSGFRRVMLPHKLLSFTFNTLILAFIINVLSS